MPSYRGAWVVQSVKRLAWAQVMILRFVSSSPATGSVLTAWSLLRILCLRLSLPLPHLCSVSLSLLKINKLKKKKKRKPKKKPKRNSGAENFNN